MKYNKPINDDVVVKRDGRVLKPSGPRAMQLKAAMKAQESETVSLLKEQVRNLTELLASSKTSNPVPSGFTAEEVDQEINKAVEVAVIETEKKFKESESRYKETIAELEEELKYVKTEFRKYRQNYNADVISDLQNKVTSLRVKVESKDEIIEALKSHVSPGGGEIGEIMERLANKVDAIANSSFEGEEFVDDPNRPKLETKFIDPLATEDEPDFEPHVAIEEEKVEPHGEKLNDKVSKLKDILGK